MKQAISGSRRKKEILVSVILIFLMLFLAMEMDELYLDPEQAFWEIEKLNGIGPSEKILLQIEDAERGQMFFVGKLPPREETIFSREKSSETEEYELYYSRVTLEKVWGIFWMEDKTNGAYTDYYHQEISAHYDGNMDLLIGACQNPDVAEVTMRWGHWLETEEKSRMIYEMGEGTYSIGEDGFFYQKVDAKDALRDKENRMHLIQTTYIEGRDKDGKILYRHGMDDAGRRFVNNEEMK